MTDAPKPAIDPASASAKAQSENTPSLSKIGWAAKGALSACSLPALVLMAAQVGFAALAREAGFTLWQTLCLTVFVWALPGQVIFVGLAGSGAHAVTVALAVGFSAMRFMPILTSWAPVVRGNATPRWLLYVLSNTVAITAWVFTMSRLPPLERSVRLPYYAGFALTLIALNAAIVVVAFNAIHALPSVVEAALVFLAPIYFLFALSHAAKDAADWGAIGSGLVIGPLIAMWAPAGELLVAGLIGGTGAYLYSRHKRRTP